MCKRVDLRGNKSREAVTSEQIRTKNESLLFWIIKLHATADLKRLVEDIKMNHFYLKVNI